MTSCEICGAHPVPLKCKETGLIYLGLGCKCAMDATAPIAGVGERIQELQDQLGEAESEAARLNSIAAPEAKVADQKRAVAASIAELKGAIARGWDRLNDVCRAAAGRATASPATGRFTGEPVPLKDVTPELVRELVAGHTHLPAEVREDLEGRVMAEMTGRLEQSQRAPVPPSPPSGAPASPAAAAEPAPASPGQVAALPPSYTDPTGQVHVLASDGRYYPLEQIELQAATLKAQITGAPDKGSQG